MKPMAKLLVLTAALCLVFTAAGLVLAQGNDWIHGDLRVDSSEVYNARDYKVSLLTDNHPDIQGDFTVAWLGLDLAQPGSGQFAQVGLLTDIDGVQWFAYAEPGVTCLRGDPAWGTDGCIGDPGDIVNFGSWHWVELVKYPGDNFWIARVYTHGSLKTRRV